MQNVCQVSSTSRESEERDASCDEHAESIEKKRKVERRFKEKKFLIPKTTNSTIAANPRSSKYEYGGRVGARDPVSGPVVSGPWYFCLRHGS